MSSYSVWGPGPGQQGHMNESHMTHERQGHHPFWLSSARRHCPPPIPTPPNSCRRQPRGQNCHWAPAQQSSWASECWQQAQGWRQGRLGRELAASQGSLRCPSPQGLQPWQSLMCPVLPLWFSLSCTGQSFWWHGHDSSPSLNAGGP